ncbi:MAG: DUF11 domain-containing protein [Candidatus Polarisedimenticolia bacterium]
MQLKYGLNASYSGTLVPGHGSSRPGLRRGLTRRIDTLVGALAIVLLLASTAALAAKPGNSLNAKACQKNGWTGLYTRSGDPFSSEQACTSYAAKGEQLIVQAALACLNNGWMALGPTSSQQFASEQACVDFANGGGTPVAAGSDLAVAKSVSDPSPNVGDQITFTVTLTNAGPDTATGVQVTDQLPAGLTFVSANPSQGFYESASGLWTVGTVSTAIPQTLAITATVVSPDARTNTATITDSDQFDPDTDNNSATATETPGQQTDLAVAKSVSDPTPNVGDQITFTITLANFGPGDATGVQVTDQLPAGLTFVSANPSQGSYESASGLWTVGTVSTAIPQTLEITATVVSPDPRTNTATITNSDQFDPDTANNSATATVTPQQADLAVAKSTSDPTPNVGDTVTFTVTLFDNGPDDATNVAVADLLPDTFSFVSAIPSQGTYDSVTGEWTVGTVTTGAPQTLEITAIVVSASPGGNTATITDSDQFDPNLANNSDTTVTDPQQANLFLLKSVSDPRPHVGDTVSFTVTLIDNGPATATGVRVTDQLPAGLTFVSATPSQGTYDAETGEWTVGTVSTDTPQTLTITAIVVSLSPRTNTATITDSDQFDPNTANNSATATVTPQQADPE